MHFQLYEPQNVQDELRQWHEIYLHSDLEVWKYDLTQL